MKPKKLNDLNICVRNEILNRVLYLPEIVEIIESIYAEGEILNMLMGFKLRHYVNKTTFNFQSEYVCELLDEKEELMKELKKDKFFYPVLVKMRSIISDYLKKFWSEDYLGIIDLLIINRILDRTMEYLTKLVHPFNSKIKLTYQHKKFRDMAYEISWCIDILIRAEEMSEEFEGALLSTIPQKRYDRYIKTDIDSELKDLESRLISRAKTRDIHPELFMCLEAVAASYSTYHMFDSDPMSIIGRGGRIFWNSSLSIDMSTFNLCAYLLPFLRKKLDGLVFISNLVDEDEDVEGKDEDEDADYDDDDDYDSIGSDLSGCLTYAVGIREDHFNFMDYEPFTLFSGSEYWTVPRYIKFADSTDKDSDVFLLIFWNDKIYIDRHPKGRSKHKDLNGPVK